MRRINIEIIARKILSFWEEKTLCYMKNYIEIEIYCPRDDCESWTTARTIS